MTYLSVAETAALLRLTPNTIRRMASRADLRASKVGGQWLFRAEDIEQDVADLANREPTRRRRRRAA